MRAQLDSSSYFEDLTNSAGDLRSLLLARLFLGVVVDGNLLEIVGFENLTAIHAVHVIDPILAHQEFRALVLTAWHSKRIYLSLF